MPPTRGNRPPRTAADEKSTLRGFLDYLRDCIVAKVTDVPEPQVRTPGVPSGTSLLGLLKHLTYVERFHLLGEPVDDWPATWRPGPGETVDVLVAEYRAAIARANRVVDDCADPALPVPRHSANMPMRWVLAHMIEETARHAGHADILREQIDGTIGR